MLHDHSQRRLVRRILLATAASVCISFTAPAIGVRPASAQQVTVAFRSALSPYGHWRHSHSWGDVWVPGQEWAPAWVVWRRGHDHIGWAPLAPQRVEHEYRDNPQVWVFVRAHDFTAPEITRVVVQEPRVTTYIHDTVVVNRTVVVQNRGPHFAVNPGIEPDVVSAVVGQPLHTYSVRPYVLAGTARLPNAVEVQAGQFRHGHHQAIEVKVQQTQTVVQPSHHVPQPQALSENSRGRLGQNPPKAAQQAAQGGQQNQQGQAVQQKAGQQPNQAGRAAQQQPNQPQNGQQGQAVQQQPNQQEHQNGQAAQKQPNSQHQQGQAEQKQPNHEHNHQGQAAQQQPGQEHHHRGQAAQQQPGQQHHEHGQAAGESKQHGHAAEQPSKHEHGQQQGQASGEHKRTQQTEHHHAHSPSATTGQSAGHSASQHQSRHEGAGPHHAQAPQLEHHQHAAPQAQGPHAEAPRAGGAGHGSAHATVGAGPSGATVHHAGAAAAHGHAGGAAHGHAGAPGHGHAGGQGAPEQHGGQGEKPH
ncbi:MAG TPA: DUF6600 domain-containing protein [Pseudolabrys sp.]|nr:DUF6600 domain-containing protein [Pseudolabrys sp.]